MTETPAHQTLIKRTPLSDVRYNVVTETPALQILIEHLYQMSDIT